jgi:hypothetical protein
VVKSPRKIPPLKFKKQAPMISGTARAKKISSGARTPVLERIIMARVAIPYATTMMIVFSTAFNSLAN